MKYGCKKKKSLRRWTSVLLTFLMLMSNLLSLPGAIGEPAPETEVVSEEPAPQEEKKETSKPKEEAPKEAPEKQEPPANAPATDAPVTQAPITQAPVTQAPATQTPAIQAPATQTPVTQAPVTQEPATEKPSADEPADAQPTDTPSGSEEPAIGQPATQAPAQEPAITEAPAKAAPESQASDSQSDGQQPEQAAQKAEAIKALRTELEQGSGYGDRLTLEPGDSFTLRLTLDASNHYGRALTGQSEVVVALPPMFVLTGGMVAKGAWGPVQLNPKDAELIGPAVPGDLVELSDKAARGTARIPVKAAGISQLVLIFEYAEAVTEQTKLGGAFDASAHLEYAAQDDWEESSVARAGDDRLTITLEPEMIAKEQTAVVLIEDQITHLSVNAVRDGEPVNALTVAPGESFEVSARVSVTNLALRDVVEAGLRLAIPEGISVEDAGIPGASVDGDELVIPLTLSETQNDIEVKFTARADADRLVSIGMDNAFAARVHVVYAPYADSADVQLSGNGQVENYAFRAEDDSLTLPTIAALTEPTTLDQTAHGLTLSSPTLAPLMVSGPGRAGELSLSLIATPRDTNTEGKPTDGKYGLSINRGGTWLAFAGGMELSFTEEYTIYLDFDFVSNAVDVLKENLSGDHTEWFTFQLPVELIGREFGPVPLVISGQAAGDWGQCKLTADGVFHVQFTKATTELASLVGFGFNCGQNLNQSIVKDIRWVNGQSVIPIGDGDITINVKAPSYAPGISKTAAWAAGGRDRIKWTITITPPVVPTGLPNAGMAIPTSVTLEDWLRLPGSGALSVIATHTIDWETLLIDGKPISEMDGYRLKRPNEDGVPTVREMPSAGYNFTLGFVLEIPEFTEAVMITFDTMTQLDDRLLNYYSADSNLNGAKIEFHNYADLTTINGVKRTTVDGPTKILSASNMATVVYGLLMKEGLSIDEHLPPDPDSYVRISWDIYTFRYFRNANGTLTDDWAGSPPPLTSGSYLSDILPEGAMDISVEVRADGQGAESKTAVGEGSGNASGTPLCYYTFDGGTRELQIHFPNGTSGNQRPIFTITYSVPKGDNERYSNTVSLKYNGVTKPGLPPRDTAEIGDGVLIEDKVTKVVYPAYWSDPKFYTGLTGTNTDSPINTQTGEIAWKVTVTSGSLRPVYLHEWPGTFMGGATNAPSGLYAYGPACQTLDKIVVLDGSGVIASQHGFANGTVIFQDGGTVNSPFSGVTDFVGVSVGTGFPDINDPCKREHWKINLGELKGTLTLLVITKIPDLEYFTDPSKNNNALSNTHAGNSVGIAFTPEKTPTKDDYPLVQSAVTGHTNNRLLKGYVDRDRAVVLFPDLAYDEVVWWVMCTASRGGGLDFSDDLAGSGMTFSALDSHYIYEGFTYSRPTLSTTYDKNVIWTAALLNRYRVNGLSAINSYIGSGGGEQSGPKFEGGSVSVSSDRKLMSFTSDKFTNVGSGFLLFFVTKLDAATLPASGESVVLRNSVTGHSDEFTTAMERSDTGTFTSKRAGKTIVSESSADDIVEWEIVINPLKQSKFPNDLIAGALPGEAVITDKLPPVFRLLDYGDITLKNELGHAIPFTTNITAYNDAEGSGETLSVSFDPAVLQGHSVTLFFRTKMIAAANGNKVTNRAKLKVGFSYEEEFSSIEYTMSHHGGAYIMPGEYINIVKVDAEDQEIALEGAEFKLWRHDTTSNQLTEFATGTLRTNSEGKMSIPLNQTYSSNIMWILQETKAPEGYELWSSSVSAGDQVIEHARYVRTSSNTDWSQKQPDERTKIIIGGTKTWADDGSPDRPGSVKLTLLADGTKVDGAAPIWVPYTAADDEWTWEFRDLPKWRIADGQRVDIVYTVAELDEDVPSGYTRIQMGNNIINMLKPGVIDFTIHKVNDAAQPMGGVEFQILKDGGPMEFTVTPGTSVYTYAEPDTDGAVTELVTDPNGSIAVKQLQTGEYTLHEVRGEGNTGHILAGDIVFTIDASGMLTSEAWDEDAGTLTVVNERMTGGFGIVKKDEAGIAMEGVEFTLYESETVFDDTTKADLQTTDVDGFAEFEGLQLGRYTLKETKASEKYDLSGMQWRIEIADGMAGAAEVTVSGPEGYENAVIDLTNRLEINNRLGLYDVALQKWISSVIDSEGSATGYPTPEAGRTGKPQVKIGEIVEFQIRVLNQTDRKTWITELSDYLPGGYDFITGDSTYDAINAANWTLTGTSFGGGQRLVSYKGAAILLSPEGEAGDSATIPLYAKINENALGAVKEGEDHSNLYNAAEVSELRANEPEEGEDQPGDQVEDSDSNPDDVPDNQSEEPEDQHQVDESGKEGGDEDTHDWDEPELVPELIGIGGTKRWEDGKNPSRPGSVKLTLFADGIKDEGAAPEWEPYTAADDVWTWEFRDLPKWRIADGQRVDIVYTVEELDEDVPEGYTRIQMGNNITNSLTPATRHIIGAFGIFKKDESGEAMEGVGFTLYNSDTVFNQTTMIAQVTTDANGYAQFNELAPGAYTLKETRAPEKYDLSGMQWTVNVADNAGESAVVTVTGPGADTETVIDLTSRLEIHNRLATYDVALQKWISGVISGEGNVTDYPLPGSGGNGKPHAKIGDIVRFQIRVLNQTERKTWITKLSDYLPAGYDFVTGDPAFDAVNAANWTLTGTSFGGGQRLVSYKGAAMLLSPEGETGDSATIPLYARINETASSAASEGGHSNLYNAAEVSELRANEPDEGEDRPGDQVEDTDSDPDGNPDNQSEEPEDQHKTEESGKQGGDEDTHDWDEPELWLYDLALRKWISHLPGLSLGEPTGQTADVPMVYHGDEVTFTLSVYNQGARATRLTELTDYLPSGYEFIDNKLDNPGWSIRSSQTNDGVYTVHLVYTPETMISLAPAGDPMGRDRVDIPLKVRVKSTAVGGTAPFHDLHNMAEISGMEDEEGDPCEDIDSTPDDNRTNDREDEDDKDDAQTQLKPPPQDRFEKNPDIPQGQKVKSGDTVDYKLTSFGNAQDAIVTHMMVGDMIPDGLTFKEIKIPAINRAEGVSYDVEYSTSPMPGTSKARAAMDNYTWNMLIGDLDPGTARTITAPTGVMGISAVRVVFKAVDENMGIPYGFGDGDTITVTFTIAGDASGKTLSNIGVLQLELLGMDAPPPSVPEGGIEVEETMPIAPITPRPPTPAPETEEPEETQSDDPSATETPEDTIVKTGQQLPLAALALGGMMMLAGIALMLVKRRQTAE